MCKIIKYLDYTKLNTLEKLYFEFNNYVNCNFFKFFISCF